MVPASGARFTDGEDLDAAGPLLNLAEIVVDAAGVEHAIARGYLVARATGPQEIETFPQFQLEEQKLEDLKGQRSLSEAMGVGNYHDLARDTKHFLNDETGIAEFCAGSEKTKPEESASKWSGGLAAGTGGRDLKSFLLRNFEIEWDAKGFGWMERKRPVRS